jgi:drug/metabolite transporter (DMT)-like permease
MSMNRWAILGLLVNATVWGLSWIGFKSLNAQGLHPLWMTAVISGFACVVMCLAKPAATLEVLRNPALRMVLLAAGLTNICFNTAVTIGDVLRVTLLFYLMPVWAAIMAHYFLGEPLNRVQTLRLLIGLLGAMLVLWQPSMGLPIPSSLSDALGIAGGFFFALNNVSLRKAQAASDNARAQAMFIGGFACSTLLAMVLASVGSISWPTGLGAAGLGSVLDAVLVLMMWALFFLAANYGVQFGAARLPANVTALIMLSEIFIAGISSAVLGHSEIRWQDLLGGALILISPFLGAQKHAPH